MTVYHSLETHSLIVEACPDLVSSGHHAILFAGVM